MSKISSTKNNFFGFTLVELIVVIAILIILGTIAFTSLVGFSSNARDSSRISDLSNLSKSLEVSYIQTSSYPLPDEYFTVTYSGGSVWTQGTIGKNVMTILSSGGAFRINKIPTDPLRTTESYTYSRLTYGKAFQIKSDFEGELVAYEKSLNPSYEISDWGDIIDNAKAESGNPTLSYIKGNYNGISAKTETGGVIYLLAVPSIITSTRMTYLSSTDIGVNAHSLSGAFLIHGSSNTQGINYNSQILYSGSVLPSNTAEHILFASSIAQAYSGTSLASISQIKSFIDATSNTGSLATLGRGLLNASLGGDTTIYNRNISVSQSDPPVPIHDSSVLKFLGFDKNIDKVFIASSIYASGWTENICDPIVPVYLVLNPEKFFGTGLVLADNTIYKVSNGTYNLTGSTLANGHIKLGNCTGVIGESKTGVVFNASFLGGSTSSAGGLFLVDGKKNAIISGLTIQGNKTGTYKYTDGIRLNNTTNNTLDNLLVYGNQYYGVITIGSSYNILNNINSNNNGSYGVILHDSSNYNKLSNLVAYANYTGLMMQVNSSYNTAKNIESYSNTNGTNGNGIFIHDGSSYNMLSDLRVYNNRDNGLIVHSGSNNNKFSDMTINRFIGLGIYVYKSHYNSFENFETYNGNIGIHLSDVSTGNYFNNFQTYNTTGGGINLNTSTNNAFNNFLSYNHGHISVEVAVNSSYNYFNNLYTFNNNVNIAGDGLSFRFYSNSNYGHLKDYRAYNNSYYGCIELSSNNITRSGIYKIFSIAGYSTTACGGLSAGNDGTTMDCSWHVKPTWMGTHLGASCTTGYQTNSYVGTSRAIYTFGSNIGNQIQPKKWDTNTNSFIDYGTDGIHYDSTKKTGQW